MAIGRNEWLGGDKVRTYRLALKCWEYPQMVIKLKCDCGERLVARDEAAGTLAVCPSCGGPVQVPTSSMAALLDEEGVTTPKECPDCMPPGAVICIDCGYNKLLGRKMKTKRS